MVWPYQAPTDALHGLAGEDGVELALRDRVRVREHLDLFEEFADQVVGLRLGRGRVPRACAVRVPAEEESDVLRAHVLGRQLLRQLRLRHFQLVVAVLPVPVPQPFPDRLDVGAVVAVLLVWPGLPPEGREHARQTEAELVDHPDQLRAVRQVHLISLDDDRDDKLRDDEAIHHHERQVQNERPHAVDVGELGVGHALSEKCSEEREKRPIVCAERLEGVSKEDVSHVGERDVARHNRQDKLEEVDFDDHERLEEPPEDGRHLKVLEEPEQSRHHRDGLDGEIVPFEVREVLQADRGTLHQELVLLEVAQGLRRHRIPSDGGRGGAQRDFDQAARGVRDDNDVHDEGDNEEEDLHNVDPREERPQEVVLLARGHFRHAEVLGVGEDVSDDREEHQDFEDNLNVVEDGVEVDLALDNMCLKPREQPSRGFPLQDKLNLSDKVGGGVVGGEVDAEPLRGLIEPPV
mmetsp:Transcript_42310/g.100496  ORF Transcript_42310/g.100496 Transcript_42310/m.100496 type:complete len:463 (-) Transcript_42310:675-2063(-)